MTVSSWCCVFVRRLRTGYGGTSCDKCSAGTFSVGGSPTPCTPCGPGQSSPAGAPSRDYCQCAAGQGVAALNGTTCTTCAANTYQPGPLALSGDRLDLTAFAHIQQESGLAQCRQCPNGRISPPGAKSADDCGECG
jgi:hypothetical protein